MSGSWSILAWALLDRLQDGAKGTEFLQKWKSIPEQRAGTWAGLPVGYAFQQDSGEKLKVT